MYGVVSHTVNPADTTLNVHSSGKGFPTVATQEASVAGPAATVKSAATYVFKIYSLAFKDPIKG